MNVPDIKELYYPQTTWKQASGIENFPSIAPSLKWSHHPLDWGKGGDFCNHTFLHPLSNRKDGDQLFCVSTKADIEGEKSPFIVGRHQCVPARKSPE